MSRFQERFPVRKPIIGVIHLPAMPGYAISPGLPGIIDKALEDLAAFEAGGVDGILVENEGDRPHRVEGTPETVATLSRVSRELVLASKNKIIGVEVLLNDPKASLAVALASGCTFMRTDFFVDPMERPEYGEMEIDAEGLLAHRTAIGADHVLIVADIQVKYSRMLVARSLRESARLAAEHGADAIGVTGTAAGDPPSVAMLEEAKQGAGSRPVLVGSGLDVDNAQELLRVADGAIVGTSLKTGPSVDPGKVRRLMEVVRGVEPSG